MASSHVSSSALLAGLAALTIALSGCATGATPAPTESVVTTAPTPTETAAATSTPIAEPTSDAVTCDTLVAEDVVADLSAKGWTFKEEPFTAGSLTLEGGLQCMWADFTTASGNLFLFGWSPVTAEEAEEAQEQLVADGWTVEQADGGGVYVTEDGTRAPTVDEDGYGMTYEFGDGWVTVADTKQNLLLIERPGA